MEYILRSASASKALHIEAVFGTEGHADAKRDQIAAAHVASGLDGSLIQTIGLFLGGLGVRPGAVITNSSPPMRAT
jgi:hypothetical protein